MGCPYYIEHAVQNACLKLFKIETVSKNTYEGCYSNNDYGVWKTAPGKASEYAKHLNVS